MTGGTGASGATKATGTTGVTGALRRLLAGRAVVIIGILGGAGLVVLAAGRPWVGRTVADVPGVARVTTTGADAAPAVTAVALVAAAGAVALMLSGRLARRVVAAVVVVVGAVVAGVVATVLRDPTGALAPALVTATGQSGPVPGGAAAATGWPWLAAAGAVLLMLCGGAAAGGRGSWGARGRRFETPSAAAGPRQEIHAWSKGAALGRAAGRTRDLDIWDALSRGQDPTQDGGSMPP